MAAGRWPCGWLWYRKEWTVGRNDRFLPRLIANLTAKTLDCESLQHAVFGQQNYFTQQFFTKHYGQYHTITLPMFPHYLILDKEFEDPSATAFYDDYLRSSWEYRDTYCPGETHNTDERREEKRREYLELYRAIAATRHLKERAFRRPIEICLRPDGKFILVHGNHRASIASKLGIPIRANTIPLEKHLRKIVHIPEEFYGSAELKIPYQSIFEGPRELVRGRRPDVYERIKMMDERDLQGKSVLELGCNLGASCYLAAQFGATSVVGVDYSHRLITAAVRLNSYFALPCSFIVHDLNTELTGIEPADTVFCFSLLRHLKDTAGIVQTIVKNTKHTLYFEGHARTTQNDYGYLLNKDYFSSIELVCHMRNSLRSDKRTRPLFRCEVAR